MIRIDVVIFIFSRTFGLGTYILQDFGTLSHALST